MNEQQINIITHTESFVTNLFENKLNKHFFFHNLNHTKLVVQAAENLSFHYQLNDLNHFILILAAWLHDTGYTAGHPGGHEKESIKIETAFLSDHTSDQGIISKVSAGIQSTVMPQNPQNLVERILCDADLFHLGSAQFNIMTGLLRQEIQSYFHIKISDEEWRLRNIEFLQSHKFFTDYCQKHLEPVKQEWLNKLLINNLEEVVH